MRLIDLSRTIKHGMPGAAIHMAKTLEQDGWNATELHLYSHCGTHVDAPVHFGVSEMTIDQMSLDHFVAEAWVADCIDIKPAGLINKESLELFADRIKPGEGILFKTGWSKKYGTDEYRNALPRISEALANWLVVKKIRLIGVEPPSIADVNNLPEVTRIHKILMEGGVTIVEGLTNLEAITNEKTLFMAIPLKIKNGDGCPARAIAIEI